MGAIGRTKEMSLCGGGGGRGGTVVCFSFVFATVVNQFESMQNLVLEKGYQDWHQDYGLWRWRCLCRIAVD